MRLLHLIFDVSKLVWVREYREHDSICHLSVSVGEDTALPDLVETLLELNLPHVQLHESDAVYRALVGLNLSEILQQLLGDVESAIQVPLGLLHAREGCYSGCLSSFVTVV